MYVKDLRIFKNVPLSNILLVDNAVYSFGEQLDNGIPIKSFMEDTNDKEFLHLMRYLEQVHEIDDFRKANQAAFKLCEINRYKLRPFIDYYDPEECEAELAAEEDEEQELNYSLDSGSSEVGMNNVRSSTGSVTNSRKARRTRPLRKSLVEPLDYFRMVMAK